MNTLIFDQNSFYLDGKPFRMIAGDVHYFRIHPSRWEEVLDLSADFGLNTIQSYVPWNAHEPEPGVYDFSGLLDLAKFLSICQEKGLKVLLRPSPYICSEWDLGGLPAWLLRDREMVLRSSDPAYLAAVERYYQHLIPVFRPYLATNGGPVIAVAIENEYGSYGNDLCYLRAMAKLLRDNGVDVPLYTTDGDEHQMLTFGRPEEDAFFGVNYRAKPGTSAHAHQMSTQYGCSPFFIGEFWGGRAMHWGEPFYHRPPEETADAFREALELGGNVCFYMFAGGTNFGFMGGGNIGRSYSPRPGTPARYIPHTTSYAEDALIGEDGQPTRKYFLCRDVLDAYLGKEPRAHVYQPREKQALDITITQTAALFENLEALTETKAFSIRPKTMEAYGQSYGLILYSTKLDGFAEQPVSIQPYKYRDRASVYVDHSWFATFLRDRGVTKMANEQLAPDGLPALLPNGEERRIDVLVENIGRVNFGRDMMDERKGLEECVLSSNAKLFGYETRTLPLKDLSGLQWSDKPHTEHLPCFFRGTFAAKRGVDSYVNFSDWGHGYIWVNGVNLGRYDSVGPHRTLYIPGAYLQEHNEIILLDLDPVGRRDRILLEDHEMLEGDGAELQ